MDIDFSGRMHKIRKKLEGGCIYDLWLCSYGAFAVYELFQACMILWFIQIYGGRVYN